MKKSLPARKSQALLDFILIFGVLLALLAGFTRVWVWFNANFAKRNVDYQNTRLAAGTAGLNAWRLNYTDAPLTIDDDWVFKGKASGSVGMPPSAVTALDILSGEGGSDGSEANCESIKTAAQDLCTQAESMDEQAENIDDFVKWGDDWYDPFYLAFKIIGIDIGAYEDARDSLRKGADDVRDAATEIQNAACGTSLSKVCN